jgi:hypothetical protein
LATRRCSSRSTSWDHGHDVDGNRLDATFIDQTGAVRDYFTMIKGVEPGEPTPPAAPDGLTATAASGGRIDLAWTDNAGNEDGFQVERSTDGSTFALHGTAGANATAYADATVSPRRPLVPRGRPTARVSRLVNVAGATTPGPRPPRRAHRHRAVENQIRWPGRTTRATSGFGSSAPPTGPLHDRYGGRRVTSTSSADGQPTHTGCAPQRVGNSAINTTGRTRSDAARRTGGTLILCDRRLSAFA